MHNSFPSIEKKNERNNFHVTLKNEVCVMSTEQLVKNLYTNVKGKFMKEKVGKQNNEESEFLYSESNADSDENTANDDPDMSMEIWKDSKRRSPLSHKVARQKEPLERIDIESTDIQNESENDKSLSSCDVLSTEKPWSQTKRIEELSTRHLIYSSGVQLDNQSLKTLLPKQYLEDNIIDAFRLLILNENKDCNALIFNTQHVVSIINENYGNQVRAKKYDIFIFPIYNQQHWTLLVVIPKHFCMLYLDSLHGLPKDPWISMICSTLKKIVGKEIDFSNWTLYVPDDIPRQEEKKTSSGNCGPHICIWEYIILTGKYIPFKEIEMNNIRSWIMYLFAEREPFKDSRQETVIPKLGKPRNIKPSKINSRIKIELPFEFKSTLEYCATLKLLLSAIKI